MFIVGATLGLSLLAKMSFSSSFGRYHPQIPNIKTGEIVGFRAIHNRAVYVAKSEKQWADIADTALYISILTSFVFGDCLSKQVMESRTYELGRVDSLRRTGQTLVWNWNRSLPLVSGFFFWRYRWLHYPSAGAQWVGDSIPYTLDPTARRIARSLNGVVTNP